MTNQNKSTLPDIKYPDELLMDILFYLITHDIINIDSIAKKYKEKFISLHGKLR